MFYTAAQTLASFVPKEDLEKGKLYPDLTHIRTLSEKIAGEGVWTALYVCIIADGYCNVSSL